MSGAWEFSSMSDGQQPAKEEPMVATFHFDDCSDRPVPVPDSRHAEGIRERGENEAEI